MDGASFTEEEILYPLEEELTEKETLPITGLFHSYKHQMINLLEEKAVEIERLERHLNACHSVLQDEMPGLYQEKEELDRKLSTIYEVLSQLDSTFS